MKYRIIWTYASGYYNNRTVEIEATDRYDAVRKLNKAHQHDGELIKVIDIKPIDQVPFKSSTLLALLFILLGCQQETTTERVARVKAGCEREFFGDTYNINRCKLKLLLEIQKELDDDKLSNARR